MPKPKIMQILEHNWATLLTTLMRHPLRGSPVLTVEVITMTFAVISKIDSEMIQIIIFGRRIGAARYNLHRFHRCVSVRRNEGYLESRASSTFLTLLVFIIANSIKSTPKMVEIRNQVEVTSDLRQQSTDIFIIYTLVKI